MYFIYLSIYGAFIYLKYFILASDTGEKQLHIHLSAFYVYF